MKSFYQKAFLALLLLVALVVPDYSVGADIEMSQDSISKLSEYSYADHDIKFTSPSGATETTDQIEISLPSGFDLSQIGATDINLSHGPSTGLETPESLSESISETEWSVALSGQKITFSHPSTDVANINPGDIITILIGKNTLAGTNQIKNGGAGNYLVIVGGSFGDNGQIPIVILSDDQLYADADILPVISMTLSNTTTSFGLVDLGTVETSTPDITITVSTNHANGYNIKVSDFGDGVHPGLFKTTNQIMPSPDPNYGSSIDLDSVIIGYGIQAACVSGCDTTTQISERYNQTNHSVGGLKIAPEYLIKYPTYPTSSHVINIKHLAKVSQYTRTGNYVDKIIYQATANY